MYGPPNYANLPQGYYVNQDVNGPRVGGPIPGGGPPPGAYVFGQGVQQFPAGFMMNANPNQPPPRSKDSPFFAGCPFPLSI